jgi:hypothetical protein
MNFRNTSAAAACAIAIAFGAAACDSAKVRDEMGRKLTLVAPAGQRLVQGETNRMIVAIARTGIDGPVQIKFEGLPAGVTVVESKPEIPAGSSTATFTLHAENDAQIVEDKKATVTAVGPNGMSVSERFEVDVVAAK